MIAPALATKRAALYPRVSDPECRIFLYRSNQTSGKLRAECNLGGSHEASECIFLRTIYRLRRSGARGAAGNQRPYASRHGSRRTCSKPI